MASLRVRPLTPEEERYARKLNKSVDSEIDFSGPLSIMGASDHPYVRDIHIEPKVFYKFYVGDGYYETLYSGGPAEGGTTVPILWGNGFREVLFVASKLGIPYAGVQCMTKMVYFQTKYESAFAECVGYAERTQFDYENKRSLLHRWFGPE